MNAPLETVQLGPCLVTGAAGFLGRNLVRKLLAGGCRVRALVHRSALTMAHPNLEIVRGDIADAQAVRDACQGINTVFHAAAQIALLGGAFVSRAYRDAAWRSNVTGTENVIAACRAQGVQRLIYTSSVDVCFNGTPLPAMTEDLPYAHTLKSVYAETKIAAEQRVLAANEPGVLLTCAIRPDGIWGAEPNEILDRVVAQLRAGRMQARMGSPDTLQDNSHVDNLVHGEILAARHLVPGGAACGQAYFIGDGEPQNTFDFFKPLFAGFNQPFPARVIPAGLLKPVAVLWQSLHFLLKIPRPALCPHELDKVTVTHYASCDKARRELGYAPVKSVAEGMQECLAYYREH